MADDPNKRARELEAALERGDKDSKKVDDKSVDDKLSEIHGYLGKMSDVLSGLGERMDAFEDRHDKRRDDGKRHRDDRKDDDSDLDWNELSPGEREELIGKEQERDPGAARELVADAACVRYRDFLRDARPHERERHREGLKFRHLAFADSVFNHLGLKAPAPYDSETFRGYRRRLLTPLQRFSPGLKDVDLKSLIDPHAFAQAEQTIYADAAREARAPSHIAAGTLRQVERTEGGHTYREFFGEPRTWMAQFGGMGRAAKGSFKTGNR
jgi:hypothetical protein